MFGHWMRKAEAALLAAEERLKSDWKWRASWTVWRAALKAGLRSHLRRMEGEGQSSDFGPVGLRRERKKDVWALDEKGGSSFVGGGGEVEVGLEVEGILDGLESGLEGGFAEPFAEDGRGGPIFGFWAGGIAK